MNHSAVATPTTSKPLVSLSRFMRTIPVTASLTIAAAILIAFPALSTALQWDITATSEWWQIVTCHLTHWSLNHLSWDLLAFAVLGAICERVSRRSFATTLLTSAIVIPIVTTLTTPRILTYRGLSGIDSALYALAACHLSAMGHREGDQVLKFVGILGWLAFVGKTIFELVSGGLLFVNDSTFIPLPASHVAGAVVGTLVFAIGKCRHPNRNASI
ncbi:MAG: rhombosortase [Planctomycetaceae bacterium]